MATDAWQQLYTDLRSRLVAERGQGATGRTGAALPKTFAHDPFVFLANLFPDVERALVMLTGDRAYPYANHAEYQAARSGQAFDPTGGAIVGSTPDPIGVGLWLTHGKEMGNDVKVRYVVPGAIGLRVPFHVIAAGSRASTAELELLLGKWNAAINRAAVAIANISRFPVLSPEATTEWWSTMYQLLVALETILEYPRPGSIELLVGGIKEATKASISAIQEGTKEAAELAGRAAAEIGKTAGIVVGAAGKGFFDQAGLTAYLMVGVAIVVAVN